MPQPPRGYRSRPQLLLPGRLRRVGPRRVLDQLATVGVDFDDVTEQLEREGLAKFEKSWNQLSTTIAAELRRCHPARQS